MRDETEQQSENDNAGRAEPGEFAKAIDWGDAENVERDWPAK